MHLNKLLFRISCIVMVILFVFAPGKLHATHNRAGEITYTHISGFTYEFTITTYTKTSSFDADRPSLGINYGDGTIDTIPRTQEIFLQNDVKMNKYTARHTYSGPFTYVVSMGDPNRIDNIINIGSSVNVIFYLEDTVRILNPNFFGYNNSPQLLYPPLDYGNVDVPFIHNPNAFDPDGDSLYFEIIPPKQGPGQDVSGYLSPSQISPGPDNIISIDHNTGELLWDAPKQQGIYNIAIIVREYRNGIYLGSVIRDLQIIVEETNNKPPKIDDLNQICMIAGDTLDFTIKAKDPDVGQFVTFTAAGAPLTLAANPATFTTSGSGTEITGRFVWRTNCDNLRKTDYQVVFRAVDNFEPPLSDVQTLNIKILAPPPKNVTGVYDKPTKTLTLRWDSLYSCSSFSKFKQFSIWRKQGCDNPLDSCTTDLAALGYEQIGTTTNYRFLDNTLKKGNEYSYRIKAEFTDKSSAGVEFNPFSSYPSDEFCIELPLDVPILYNVDVRTTDISSGQIYVEWGNPNPVALDTLFNPGPYKYILYRAEGIDGESFVPITTKTAPNFSSLLDTSFLDNGLNTFEKAYRYKVDFISVNDTIGSSEKGSSVFLTTSPIDQAINLSWIFNVPWINEQYVIYRRTDVTPVFVIIDTVSTTTYFDGGLDRDSVYCYKIEAIGAYTNPVLKHPLINFSQESCAQPKDTVVPCPPVLTVRNFCNDASLPEDDFINYLKWKLDETPECQDGDTIVKFNIYFAPTQNASLELIATIDDVTLDSFQHDRNIEKMLSGCYVVTAFDGVGNESSKSNIVCVNNCPIYELPNAFTPNGDNKNDLYTPIIPYRFVTRINMQIFNRWGVKVFETSDPDIVWDGTDFKNQKLLESGVYSYICEVYFETVSGEEKLEEPLSGFIHLFRE